MKEPAVQEQETFSQLQSETLRLAGQLAAALERGQAHQPLFEEAQRVAAAPADSLALALASTDPATRDAVLRWLIGPHHQRVTVHLFEAAGLVEVRLQERGFTIESEVTGRREFASVEQFLAVLQDALRAVIAEHSPAESIALGLAAPPALRNLRLTILPEPRRIADAGVIPALLARGANVLAVALPAAGLPDRETLAAWRLLAPVCVALWPMVVGEGPAAGAEPALCQLQGLGLPLLPISVLTDPDEAFLPDLIARGPRQPLRAALAALASTQAAASLTEMLAERYETDVGQLKARIRREGRLERGGEAAARDQSARAEFEQIKLQAGEDFASLAQALRENHRRALLKNGEIGRALGELARSIQAADLEREAATKAIRLSFNRQALDEIRKRFVRVLRKLLDEECVIVRDSFEVLRKRTEENLRTAGAATASLPLPVPDDRELWEALQDTVHLEFKYRGEVPRRGLMQRLGQGRQVVFGGLMVLSLAGGFIGFNIRQATMVGVGLVLVFLGVVAYTYRAWRREDDELIGREIEKVRDTVLAELERLATELVRDLQTRLLDFIDQARRDALGRLDVLAKQTQLALAAAAETEKRHSRSRLKLLEQRDREFQGLGQQVARLRQQLGQLETAARALLSAALGGNGGGGR